MNYQRTNRPSRRPTKIVIAVAVVLLLLRLIIPHAFGAFFTALFSPLWRVENFVVRSVAPESQIVFSSDSPFASSTAAELLQENNALKDMLGRPTTPNAVVTAVLSKPPFSAYDTLIADAGSNQGVEAGDKVYALADPVVYSTASDTPPSATSTSILLSSSTTATTSVTLSKSQMKQLQAEIKLGDQVLAESSTSSSTAASNTPENSQIQIPIGQVVTTYGDTSVVTLFSSPGQRYPVEIGSFYVSATAVAEGAGMFEAMVPNNSNINVGDPVIIPSIQTGVFASVVSVVSDPARPYSVILFQSPVDPFSLYFIEIEKANEAK